MLGGKPMFFQEFGLGKTCRTPSWVQFCLAGSLYAPQFEAVLNVSGTEVIDMLGMSTLCVTIQGRHSVLLVTGCAELKSYLPGRARHSALAALRRATSNGGS